MGWASDEAPLAVTPPFCRPCRNAHGCAVQPLVGRPLAGCLLLAKSTRLCARLLRHLSSPAQSPARGCRVAVASALPLVEHYLGWG